jgi:hypothetical protein
LSAVFGDTLITLGARRDIRVAARDADVARR